MKTEANLQKTEMVNTVMGIKCHHLQAYGGHSLLWGH